MSDKITMNELRRALRPNPTWLSGINRGRVSIRKEEARDSLVTLISNSDHASPVMLFGMHEMVRKHEAYVEELTAENDNG